jgi:hypothetical protein
MTVNEKLNDCYELSSVNKCKLGCKKDSMLSEIERENIGESIDIT